MKRILHNQEFQILIKSFGYVREYKYFVVLSVVFMFGSMFLTTLQPLMFGLIIDKINEGDMSTISSLVLILAGILFSHILIQFFQGSLQIKIASKIELTMKQKVFRSILDLKMKSFEHVEKGKLMNHLEADIQTFSNMFTDKLSIFVDIFSILLISFLMFRIDYQLTLLLFATFPLTSLVFGLFGRKIKREEQLLKKKSDRYFTFIQECLNHFKLIKVAGAEQRQTSRYMDLNFMLYKIGIRKGKLNITGSALSQLVNYSAYIGIIFCGVIKIVAGSLTIGNLVAFNSYSSTLTNSLMRISHLNSELQEVLVSLQRLDEITNNLYKESEKPSGAVVPRIDSLKMENLLFQYHHTLKPTVSNLNIHLQERGLYYITGPSGAGKSTLLNIIAGLYPDYEGDFFINQQNLSSFDLRTYRDRICYILQENQLFSMSIMENLTLLNLNVSDNEVFAICKQLNLHDFIIQLPDGYNTMIGAQGILLSEGQKQRICIARSILKKADIYLCDEISSALDYENQKLVEELLSEFSRAAMVIAVSHHQLAGNLEILTEYNGSDDPIQISKIRSLQKSSLVTK